MPSNNRADNQYYGKYRECCVVSCLNGTDVEYYENFEFSEAEKLTLLEESKIIANYLGEHKASYIGNMTSTASGDILLDNGETIEIKCVSSGTGTYFNTSIYYFEKFGFNFKNYMKEYGLYEALKTHFPAIRISETNNSPVSQANSSLIRHNYTDLYEQYIIPLDEQIRIQFTNDIANYFIQNPEKIYEFISDMLNKNTISSQKQRPDRLIVFNYTKKIIKELDLIQFLQDANAHIRKTDKGLIIGNVRLMFSWQNGIGLNNPTIRVFLEE